MSDRTPPPRRRIAGEAAPAPVVPVAAEPPAKKTPAKKAPTQKAAARKAPAKKTAAKKAPAKKVAAKSAPSTKAPAAEAVTSTSPVAKKAPAKKTSAKKAPATKAPAKKTPAKKAPAQKASVAAAASTATATGAASSVDAAKAPTTPQVARLRPRTPERTDTPARDRRSTIALAMAAVVLVAGAVVGTLGFLDWRGSSFTESRTEAVSAASTAAETIFSFSYDNLDEHLTESKALMTPSFAKEFDTIAPALTDIAPQRQVIVEAVTRNAAALPCGDECSTTKASVLVFLDQDRRIENDETSTVFGNRIVVDLLKTGGDWKVNQIRAL